MNDQLNNYFANQLFKIFLEGKFHFVRNKINKTQMTSKQRNLTSNQRLDLSIKIKITHV